MPTGMMKAFLCSDGRVRYCLTDGRILNIFLLHRGMVKTYQRVTELLEGAPDLVWTVTMAGALRWHEFSEKCNLKLPFVLQEHSNTVWMHLKSNAAIKRSSRILKEASAIIVVAERQIEQFKNLEPTVEPVVIWNAVDPAYLKPCTEKPDGSRILFVGRLSAEKGLGRLIKAIPIVIKSFSDITVELIGRGPMKQVLEEEISAIGVMKYVKFLGVKTPEEIATILDKAAVFVLPSEYENCPVALLEAQVRGVPCVVRNNNASERVLLPGNGVGVDDDGNGHGIAAGLCNVLEQLEKYDRVEIQKRSMQQFSPDVFAHKMCDVFKRACV
jgi:glycosyltransferase involved in cell wall biosynthesis